MGWLSGLSTTLVTWRSRRARVRPWQESYFPFGNFLLYSIKTGFHHQHSDYWLTSHEMINILSQVYFTVRINLMQPQSVQLVERYINHSSSHIFRGILSHSGGHRPTRWDITHFGGHMPILGTLIHTGELISSLQRKLYAACKHRILFV